MTKNKWIAFGSCLLLGALFIFIYAYTGARNQNVALRIKLQSLEEDRKQESSLSKRAQRLAQRQEEPSPPPKEAQGESAEAAPDKPTLRERTDLALSKMLDSIMANFRNASLEELLRGERIAQELIDRDPLNYSAHKAKLILLLTQEAKFGEDVSDNELNYLLSEMVSFEVSETDPLFVKERLRQMNTEASEQENDRRVEELQNDLNLTRLSLLEAPEGSEMEENLLEREEYLSAELERASLQLESPERQELIEIPFQRSLAMEEYSRVIDDSIALLDWFPNSVVGHYYLIRALELSGQEQEALGILSSVDLAPQELEALSRRLAQDRDPKEYWKYLEY